MNFNRHHRRALKVLAVTVVLDVILGVLYGVAEHVHVLHGLYCAIGTATTVGCDIPPDNGPAYVLTVIMMLTVVPLWGATFSYFTSGLTSDHVDAAASGQTAELKEHVDALTSQQTRQIKDHISG